MKTIKIVALTLVYGLLISCTGDNPIENTYYSKCYFLGEKSFTFEGEIFNDYKPPMWEPQPKPYESVVVRLNSSLYTVDLYEGWEISETNISKNKFQIEIDTNANGITIDKNLITDNVYSAHFFSNDFPAVQLMFCFKVGEWSNIDREPLFKELRYLSKTEYDYYYCNYVFVAEPINLSGKRIQEGKGVFGYYIDTYYDDLNFSKPGWYKIIKNYRSGFGNDPKFSSTKNNYFSY